MPWSVVLNAAEYGKDGADYEEPPAAASVDAPGADVVAPVAVPSEQHAGDTGKPAGATGAKGVMSMGLIETLKEKFKGHGVPEEDLADLDQLAATPPVDPPAAPTPPATPPAPPVDPAMKAQLEQLAKANETLRGTVETMAAEARRTKAASMVDGWVNGGKLPPALAVPAFALVDALSAATLPAIDVLEVKQAEDGTETQGTRQSTALDLLGEIVNGYAPIHKGAPRGMTLTLATDDPTPDPTMTPEQLDALAKLAQGGK